MGAAVRCAKEGAVPLERWIGASDPTPRSPGLARQIMRGPRPRATAGTRVRTRRHRVACARMSKTFQLAAPFEPRGDQPTAIASLSRWVQEGAPAATLL